MDNVSYLIFAAVPLLYIFGVSLRDYLRLRKLNSAGSRRTEPRVRITVNWYGNRRLI